MINPITYLKETKTELRHVSWPTRKQAVQFTALVIAVSLVFAAMLGFFDFIYDIILEKFIIGSDVPVTPVDALPEGVEIITEEILNEEGPAENTGSGFVIPEEVPTEE